MDLWCRECTGLSVLVAYCWFYATVEIRVTLFDITCTVASVSMIECFIACQTQGQLSWSEIRFGNPFRIRWRLVCASSIWLVGMSWFRSIWPECHLVSSWSSALPIRLLVSEIFFLNCQIGASFGSCAYSDHSYPSYNSWEVTRTVSGSLPLSCMLSCTFQLASKIYIDLSIVNFSTKVTFSWRNICWLVSWR